jgi:hypothetical protein
MLERAAWITTWKVAYYQGDPLVDDQTFDLHWRNLLWLEERYPHLVPPDSPTRGVGAPLAELSRKPHHDMTNESAGRPPYETPDQRLLRELLEAPGAPRGSGRCSPRCCKTPYGHAQQITTCPCHPKDTR